MSFRDLSLSPAVLAALPSQYHAPTPIQQQAIPAMLRGQDVLALAQTGSGKTLAFGLGLLQQLALSSEDAISLAKLTAVVIVPTRELAAQINDVLAPLSKALNIAQAMVCGGIGLNEQVAMLEQAPPRLLIATPGRLLDLITQRLISVNQVKHLVLDEADRLLEMGFWPDLQRIVQAMPAQQQRLLFSATLAGELAEKVSLLMPNAQRIEVGEQNQLVDAIEQRCYLVNKGSKAQALIALLKETFPQQPALVFINARDSADALAKKLNKAGIVARALHGEKDHAEREQALLAFKKGEVRVLVATDLLARGIDISALPVVINLDLPPSAPVYVHRVGRTARAGMNGVAISLVCHGEMPALAAIRELTGAKLALEHLEGFAVTDKPASGERKRPVRDKKANRRRMNNRRSNK
ncbi:DEAD/DEAH box helicase [Oceanisphaera pacifica]|uniref:DEAD/DEAH box helicase n=1 Tax=Oceanisphaera pacifica TaxID=2818389 RepID=A0ABS3NGK5_9GAMM|nr:DEAD/DEAH box helicase [Oceanisphaera pacifica]MBO1519467.1 DEAD/DEAH box helicase [Oceanisphaera pacifica]